MLDTEAGVYYFDIGRRMRDENHRSHGCSRHRRLSIGACQERIYGGLKLRFRRRVRLDKVLEGQRLAIVLRLGWLFAGMLTTIVRGRVGSETEHHLRAGEAITPHQRAQQQERQERIGNGPHGKQIIAPGTGSAWPRFALAYFRIF
jgi:hypothetical protein